MPLSTPCLFLLQFAGDFLTLGIFLLGKKRFHFTRFRVELFYGSLRASNITFAHNKNELNHAAVSAATLECLHFLE